MNNKYPKPIINIIGENNDLNIIIKKSLLESKFYSEVFLNIEDENKNSDILLCTSISDINVFQDYLGVKVLFTGSCDYIIEKLDIKKDILIISKSAFVIRDLSSMIYNYFLKNKGTII